MNYEPNTTRWRANQLVLHDADAKHPRMLMVVVGYTRDGLVKTQYLDPRGIRNGGRSRRIFKNDLKYLHDPDLFLQMSVKDIHPYMDAERFESFISEYDRMIWWNKTFEKGQRVKTTSADGGFETVTGYNGQAYMSGLSAHIWLEYVICEDGKRRGGGWWLKFVEPIVKQVGIF